MYEIKDVFPGKNKKLLKNLINLWNLLLLEMIKYKVGKIQTNAYIVLWLRKVFCMKDTILPPVIFVMHTYMMPEQTYASKLPSGIF